MRALLLSAGQSFVPGILVLEFPIQLSVRRWILKSLILELDGDHPDRSTRNAYQETRLIYTPGRGALSLV